MRHETVRNLVATPHNHGSNQPSSRGTTFLLCSKAGGNICLSNSISTNTDTHSGTNKSNQQGRTETKTHYRRYVGLCENSASIDIKISKQVSLVRLNYLVGSYHILISPQEGVMSNHNAPNHFTG